MSGGKGGAAPAAGSASPAGLTVPLSIWKKGAACLCLSPAMGERPLPLALVKRCPCPSSPGFGPVRWLLNESEAGRSPSHGGLTCCLHGRSRRSFICPSWLSQSQAVEEPRIKTRPESVHPSPFTPASLVFLLLSSCLARSTACSGAFPHSTEGHQGFSSPWPRLPGPTGVGRTPGTMSPHPPCSIGLASELFLH